MSGNTSDQGGIVPSSVDPSFPDNSDEALAAAHAAKETADHGKVDWSGAEQEATSFWSSIFGGKG